MDFPKVYFFGSLRNSLLPISQNRNFAAIFCWISNNDPENVLFVVASLRSAKGRRPVLSQSFVVLHYHISFVVVICSRLRERSVHVGPLGRFLTLR